MKVPNPDRQHVGRDQSCGSGSGISVNGTRGESTGCTRLCSIHCVLIGGVGHRGVLRSGGVKPGCGMWRVAVVLQAARPCLCRGCVRNDSDFCDGRVRRSRDLRMPQMKMHHGLWRDMTPVYSEKPWMEELRSGSHRDYTHTLHYPKRLKLSWRTQIRGVKIYYPWLKKTLQKRITQDGHICPTALRATSITLLVVTSPEVEIKRIVEQDEVYQTLPQVCQCSNNYLVEVTSMHSRSHNSSKGLTLPRKPYTSTCTTKNI